MQPPSGCPATQSEDKDRPTCKGIAAMTISPAILGGRLGEGALGGQPPPRGIGAAGAARLRAGSLKPAKRRKHRPVRWPLEGAALCALEHSSAEADIRGRVG